MAKLEERLEQDIKQALLARDSFKVSTLRTIKAALLNVKVASGKRDSGLSDDEVINIFSKEAKKRQESADLYKQGGDEEKANKELQEKALIETYLPTPISESELKAYIDELAAKTDGSQKNMGLIIGQVKAKYGAAADGSLVAKLTKESLS